MSTRSSRATVVEQPLVGQTVYVPAPTVYLPYIVSSSAPDGDLVLGFDPSSANVEREGNNLVFTLEEGGTVILRDFFVTGNYELPMLHLPDGSVVPSLQVILALNEDLDVTLSADVALPDTKGSGTSYDDDAGELIGGVTRLGAQDGAGWQGAGPGAGREGTAFIDLSVRPLPELQLGVGLNAGFTSAFVNESEGTFTLSFTLSQPALTDVVVTLRLDGTVLLAEDLDASKQFMADIALPAGSHFFIGAGGALYLTVTIPAGITIFPLTFLLNDDHISESSDETLIFTLMDITGARGAVGSSATLVVKDDTQIPQVGDGAGQPNVLDGPAVGAVTETTAPIEEQAGGIATFGLSMQAGLAGATYAGFGGSSVLSQDMEIRLSFGGSAEYEQDYYLDTAKLDALVSQGMVREYHITHAADGSVEVSIALNGQVGADGKLHTAGEVAFDLSQLSNLAVDAVIMNNQQIDTVAKDIIVTVTNSYGNESYVAPEAGAVVTIAPDTADTLNGPLFSLTVSAASVAESASVDPVYAPADNLVYCGISMRQEAIAGISGLPGQGQQGTHIFATEAVHVRLTVEGASGAQFNPHAPSAGADQAGDDAYWANLQEWKIVLDGVDHGVASVNASTGTVVFDNGFTITGITFTGDGAVTFLIPPASLGQNSYETIEIKVAIGISDDMREGEVGEILQAHLDLLDAAGNPSTLPLGEAQYDPLGQHTVTMTVEPDVAMNFDGPYVVLERSGGQEVQEGAMARFSLELRDPADPEHSLFTGLTEQVVVTLKVDFTQTLLPHDFVFYNGAGQALPHIQSVDDLQLALSSGVYVRVGEDAGGSPVFALLTDADASGFTFIQTFVNGAGFSGQIALELEMSDDRFGGVEQVGSLAPEQVNNDAAQEPLHVSILEVAGNEARLVNGAVAIEGGGTANVTTEADAVVVDDGTMAGHAGGALDGPVIGLSVGGESAQGESTVVEGSSAITVHLTDGGYAVDGGGVAEDTVVRLQIDLHGAVYPDDFSIVFPVGVNGAIVQESGFLYVDITLPQGTVPSSVAFDVAIVNDSVNEPMGEQLTIRVVDVEGGEASFDGAVHTISIEDEVHAPVISLAFDLPLVDESGSQDPVYALRNDLTYCNVSLVNNAPVAGANPEKLNLAEDIHLRVQLGGLDGAQFNVANPASGSQNVGDNAAWSSVLQWKVVLDGVEYDAATYTMDSGTIAFNGGFSVTNVEFNSDGSVSFTVPKDAVGHNLYDSVIIKTGVVVLDDMRETESGERLEAHLAILQSPNGASVAAPTAGVMYGNTSTTVEILPDTTAFFDGPYAVATRFGMSETQEGSAVLFIISLQDPADPAHKQFTSLEEDVVVTLKVGFGDTVQPHDFIFYNASGVRLDGIGTVAELQSAMTGGAFIRIGTDMHGAPILAPIAGVDATGFTFVQTFAHGTGLEGSSAGSLGITLEINDDRYGGVENAGTIATEQTSHDLAQENVVLTIQSVTGNEARLVTGNVQASDGSITTLNTAATVSVQDDGTTATHAGGHLDGPTLGIAVQGESVGASLAVQENVGILHVSITDGNYTTDAGVMVEDTIVRVLVDGKTATYGSDFTVTFPAGVTGAVVQVGTSTYVDLTIPKGVDPSSVSFDVNITNDSINENPAEIFSLKVVDVEGNESTFVTTEHTIAIGDDFHDPLVSLSFSSFTVAESAIVDPAYATANALTYGQILLANGTVQSGATPEKLNPSEDVNVRLAITGQNGAQFNSADPTTSPVAAVGDDAAWANPLQWQIVLDGVLYNASAYNAATDSLTFSNGFVVTNISFHSSGYVSMTIPQSSIGHNLYDSISVKVGVVVTDDLRQVEAGEKIVGQVSILDGVDGAVLTNPTIGAQYNPAGSTTGSTTIISDSTANFDGPYAIIGRLSSADVLEQSSSLFRVELRDPADPANKQFTSLEENVVVTLKVGLGGTVQPHDFIFYNMAGVRLPNILTVAQLQSAITTGVQIRVGDNPDGTPVFSKLLDADATGFRFNQTFIKGTGLENSSTGSLDVKLEINDDQYGGTRTSGKLVENVSNDAARESITVSINAITGNEARLPAASVPTAQGGTASMSTSTGVTIVDDSSSVSSGAGALDGPVINAVFQAAQISESGSSVIKLMFRNVDGTAYKNQQGTLGVPEQTQVTVHFGGAGQPASFGVDYQVASGTSGMSVTGGLATFTIPSGYNFGALMTATSFTFSSFKFTDASGNPITSLAALKATTGEVTVGYTSTSANLPSFMDITALQKLEVQVEGDVTFRINSGTNLLVDSSLNINISSRNDNYSEGAEEADGTTTGIEGLTVAVVETEGSESRTGTGSSSTIFDDNLVKLSITGNAIAAEGTDLNFVLHLNNTPVENVTMTLQLGAAGDKAVLGADFFDQGTASQWQSWLQAKYDALLGAGKVTVLSVDEAGKVVLNVDETAWTRITATNYELKFPVDAKVDAILGEAGEKVTVSLVPNSPTVQNNAFGNEVVVDATKASATGTITDNNLGMKIIGDTEIQESRFPLSPGNPEASGMGAGTFDNMWNVATYKVIVGELIANQLITAQAGDSFAAGFTFEVNVASASATFTTSVLGVDLSDPAKDFTLCVVHPLSHSILTFDLSTPAGIAEFIVAANHFLPVGVQISNVAITGQGAILTYTVLPNYDPSQPIALQVVGFDDQMTEGDENFKVNLQNVNAISADINSITITADSKVDTVIVDDIVPQDVDGFIVSLQQSYVQESDGTAYLVVRATNIASLEAPNQDIGLVLQYGAAGDTAQVNIEYRDNNINYTIPPSQWVADGSGSWVCSVPIPIVEERLSDDSQHFTVSLQEVIGNETRLPDPAVPSEGLTVAQVIIQPDVAYAQLDGPVLAGFYLGDKLMEPDRSSILHNADGSNATDAAGNVLRVPNELGYTIEFNASAAETIIVTLSLNESLVQAQDFSVGRNLYSVADYQRFLAGDTIGMSAPQLAGYQHVQQALSTVSYASSIGFGSANYFTIVEKGGSSANFSVQIAHDNISETQDALHWQIVGAQGSEVRIPDNSPYTECSAPIIDDGQGPIVALTGGGLVADGSLVQYTVRLSEPAGEDVIATVRLVHGATTDADFFLTGWVKQTDGSWTKNVTVTAGSTSASVDLPLRDIAVLEKDEVFFVQISGSKGGESTANTSFVSSLIGQDPLWDNGFPPPFVSIIQSQNSVLESAGDVTNNYSFVLDNITHIHDMQVFYNVTSGSAGLLDYTASGGSVAISAAEVTAWVLSKGLFIDSDGYIVNAQGSHVVLSGFTKELGVDGNFIRIVDDLLTEGNERFSVQISDYIGVRPNISGMSVSTTIIDDDLVISRIDLDFASHLVTGLEGNAVAIDLTMTPSGTLLGDAATMLTDDLIVTVKFYPDSATAGADFIPGGQTIYKPDGTVDHYERYVTIPAGTKYVDGHAVTVNLPNDFITEGKENFTVEVVVKNAGGMTVNDSNTHGAGNEVQVEIEDSVGERILNLELKNPSMIEGSATPVAANLTLGFMAEQNTFALIKVTDNLFSVPNMPVGTASFDDLKTMTVTFGGGRVVTVSLGFDASGNPVASYDGGPAAPLGLLPNNWKASVDGNPAFSSGPVSQPVVLYVDIHGKVYAQVCVLEGTSSAKIEFVSQDDNLSEATERIQLKLEDVTGGEAVAGNSSVLMFNQDDNADGFVVGIKEEAGATFAENSQASFHIDMVAKNSSMLTANEDITVVCKFGDQTNLDVLEKNADGTVNFIVTVNGIDYQFNNTFVSSSGAFALTLPPQLVVPTQGSTGGFDIKFGLSDDYVVDSDKVSLGIAGVSGGESSVASGPGAAYCEQTIEDTSGMDFRVDFNPSAVSAVVYTITIGSNAQIDVNGVGKTLYELSQNGTVTLLVNGVAVSPADIIDVNGKIEIVGEYPKGSTLGMDLRIEVAAGTPESVLNGVRDACRDNISQSTSSIANITIEDDFGLDSTLMVGIESETVGAAEGDVLQIVLDVDKPALQIGDTLEAGIQVSLAITAPDVLSLLQGQLPAGVSLVDWVETGTGYTATFAIASGVNISHGLIIPLAVADDNLEAAARPVSVTVTGVTSDAIGAEKPYEKLEINASSASGSGSIVDDVPGSGPTVVVDTAVTSMHEGDTAVFAISTNRAAWSGLANNVTVDFTIAVEGYKVGDNILINGTPLVVHGDAMFGYYVVVPILKGASGDPAVNLTYVAKTDTTFTADRSISMRVVDSGIFETLNSTTDSLVVTDPRVASIFVVGGNLVDGTGSGGDYTADYSHVGGGINALVDATQTLVSQGGAEDTITQYSDLLGTDSDDTFGLLGVMGHTYAGGAGSDILDYSTVSHHLVIDATTGMVTGASGESDSFQGFEVLKGGMGDDTISGSAANEALYGGAGNDSLVAQAGTHLLDGGDGNDTILGADGNDTLLGGDGSDTLSGRDGNDHMSGGMGDDALLGGEGDDSLLGDDGNDLLIGGAGVDLLDGGSGNDILFAHSGIDTLHNDFGDRLYGGVGDDSLYSGGSDDILSGGDGSDILVGSSGNSFLFGDAGNDTIVGGTGNEHIVGGAGDDSLTGGAGDDVFVWKIEDLPAAGQHTVDVITDFTLGDKIDLTALNITALDVIASSNVNGNLQLSIGDQHIVFENTSVDHMEAQQMFDQMIDQQHILFDTGG